MYRPLVHAFLTVSALILIHHAHTAHTYLPRSCTLRNAHVCTTQHTHAVSSCTRDPAQSHKSAHDSAGGHALGYRLRHTRSTRTCMLKTVCHTRVHADPACARAPQRAAWQAPAGVGYGAALTSGCRAGRRSSRGDRRCPGPASPSRRLGSACYRQRSFLWCRTACRGKGAEGSGAAATQGPTGPSSCRLSSWAWAGGRGGTQGSFATLLRDRASEKSAPPPREGRVGAQGLEDTAHPWAGLTGPPSQAPTGIGLLEPRATEEHCPGPRARAAVTEARTQGQSAGPQAGPGSL